MGRYVDGSILPGRSFRRYDETMSEIPSLLANVSAEDVITEPVPHVVVKNVLEDRLYRRLSDEYPSVDILADGRPYASNSRLNCSASRVFGNDAISPLWQEFVKVQTSPAYFADFVRIFGDHARRLHSLLPDPGTFRPGVRYVDSYDDRDILLDCQICANTPVVGFPSSPRRGHLDQSVKLFFGLLYFRRPDDDSTGGHLELYRYRRGIPEGFVQKSDEPAKKSRSIPDAYLDVVQTIRNEPNLLFIAVNSVYATHGVSVRSVTSVPRNFVNLLGDLPEPLFEYDAYPDVSFLRDRATRVVGWLRSIRARRNGGSG